MQAAARALAPDEKTIAGAYVYLLGHVLVIRQERMERKGPGFAYNRIKYNPLGLADFVNPNFDVAYVEAWFAVDDKTAVLLEIPEIKGRYYTVIGGSWSDKSFVSNEQDPRLILNFFLPGTVPVQRQSGSWSVYYNFDQFLYTSPEHPEQGIGIFGRVGFADTETSPLEQFYSVGVGGKGMIPGRARDQFGFGYYYMRVSHELPGLLLRSHEQGFELYYTAAATNWLYVTPDIQVIEPGRQVSSAAFVTGGRVHTRF